MNQKQLEVTIREALLEMLLEQAITLPVLASFPPSKQGRVTDGIYFFLISKGKHGWQTRKYRTQDDLLKVDESQINEYMFQFQAFVKDNGKVDGQLLAEDVLSLVRGTVQSLAFVEKMHKQGIGVQRATDILTPTFINEHDNFEHNPNFTIIFSHTRKIAITTPEIKTLELHAHIV